MNTPFFVVTHEYHRWRDDTTLARSINSFKKVYTFDGALKAICENAAYVKNTFLGDIKTLHNLKYLEDGSFIPYNIIFDPPMNQKFKVVFTTSADVFYSTEYILEQVELPDEVLNLYKLLGK